MEFTSELKGRCSKILNQTIRTSRKNLEKQIVGEIFKRLSITVDPKKILNQNPIVRGHINNIAAVATAKHILKILKYLIKVSGCKVKRTISQFIISTALENKTLHLLQDLLDLDTEILDFQGLGYDWKRPFKLEDFIELKKGTNVESVSSDFLQSPPNEFDWFSLDKLGRVLSLKYVEEILEVIKKSSKRLHPVREIYISSQRPSKASRRPDLVTSILGSTEKLTVLVLRGCADDIIMKFIGARLHNLKVLDVTGSIQVSDEGIKNLLFKDTSENDAIYLVKAFTHRNMNPVAHSLMKLNYSWTSVSTYGRSMIQCIPNVFMFKRMLLGSNSDGYGHHIFVKNPLIASLVIPNTDAGYVTFRENLKKVANEEVADSCIQLCLKHPWKACYLNLYQSSQSQANNEQLGIITPNMEERRIYGVVEFRKGNVVKIYSIFPFNVKNFAVSCPKLRCLQGILNLTSKVNASFFLNLGQLDIFADVETIQNLLESIPNLVSVRIRVIRNVLKSEDFKMIPTMMCRKSLRELWIGPGAVQDSSEMVSRDVNRCVSNIFTAETGKTTESAKNTISVHAKLSHTSAIFSEDEQPDNLDHNDLDDLIRLGLETIRMLTTFCPKLQRLGDLAWWPLVSMQDLFTIYHELQENGRNLNFIWANYMYPDIPAL